MTPQQIVETSLVSGTKRVFVLGCFEQRVTVYSQQVRALNLVDAIIFQELVRLKNGKVAIVGGGAAGMTAAVAFAKAAPGLATLDFFESRSEILQLQRSSQRFLHPHFYDWPAPGAEDPKAGLPIMNWHAGTAGDVAKTLCAEFEQELKRTSYIHVHTDDEVVELVSSDLGPVRVKTASGKVTDRIYDVVILAIGFGVERYLGSQTSSYWTPSELSGPILAKVDAPLIFISGNGDGGLVDFLMAAFNSYEHSDICEFLIGLDLGPALAVLEVIEEEAWAADADVDLLVQYRARVHRLIPSPVWLDILERLRPNVRICLHTNEPRLLRRATALHNRFLVFLVLEADADDAMGRKAITVKVGVGFDGMPPEAGDVTLVGESACQPFKRILRLGPDGESNLKSFAVLLAAYRVAVERRRPITRPVSPRLTTTAVSRFEPYRVASGAALVPPVPVEAAHPGGQCVTVTFSGDGRVVWSGVAPAKIHLLWGNGITVDFYCDINAADASQFLPAIARLGGHAKSFTLITRDTARWQSALSSMWSDRSHPGPNLSLGCPIVAWREPPALDGPVEFLIGELADTIHERLDADTLNAVHEALFDVLGPPSVPTGWMVESALRERLWELWRTWRAALAGNTETRRRFLRLLASVNDKVDVEEAALVRVGPKIVRRYLTMPTIFALAFAACSGRPIAPAAKHPGNVAVDLLTGHTCGVEWIERRTICGGMVGQHTWTTSVVLLSELREAVQFVEGDLRLDQVDSDPPRVGTTSLSDRSILIGADSVFLSALEVGDLAVQRFFQSIFQRRTDAARQSLEEVDGVQL